MPTLTATYSSPLVSTPHIIVKPLSEGAEKSSALAELRNAVGTLQGEVNAYLTERMEEGKGGSVVEEQKYGEEEEEDDDDGGAGGK